LERQAVIGLAYISDRGDLYLPQCEDSLNAHLRPINESVVIDDRDHTLGMAGAVQAAWDWALTAEVDYLLAVEEDFVFLADVDLSMLAAILDWDQTLAQVVLLREPFSPLEIAAGGIVHLDPFLYTEESFGPGCTFLRHGAIRDWGWSCNPCLIPRRVLEMSYPDTNEQGMTRQCLDAGLQFAFYGARDDPPRCRHIGAVRGQGWRL
jgi:hypothetical protein